MSVKLTNATVGATVRSVSGISGAALVEVLGDVVGKGIVAVVGEDLASDTRLVNKAVSMITRVASVEGRLVVGLKVPVLVDVNLALVGPVRALGPAKVGGWLAHNTPYKNKNGNTYKAGHRPQAGLGKWVKRATIRPCV